MWPLTVAEYAAHLGVSRQHIYQALKAMDKAKQQGRTYKGRVRQPDGYKDGKPYWIVE